MYWSLLTGSVFTEAVYLHLYILCLDLKSFFSCTYHGYEHFQDERERIEKMGGSVLYWGTWRVNGQLAVSRAIGEPQKY